MGEAVSSAADVVSGAAEKFAPVVGNALEDLSPAAAAAATATGKRSRGALQAIRSRVSRLKPPPKPVLLLLCVGALRYGLVRTALAASAAKLTIDIGQETYDAARRRLGRGDTGAEDASGEDGQNAEG